MSAYNAKTKINYQGRNASALADGEWATFLQWKDLGFSVKKGEHGTRIIKFVDFTKKNAKGKTVAAQAPRFYTVFSREQVEEAKAE